jgi:DNA polymerase
MKSWHDLETYSEVPITNGTHSYAEKAEILLWTYAVEDGPVQVWDLTAEPGIPSGLSDILVSDMECWWHNGGMFDRVILKHAFPFADPIQRDRWRDTMVQALCHGLPGSLGTLCEIFNLPTDVAKDKRGKQLIQMFCKPQPANQKLRRKTRETHPVEWAEFIDYAKSDISAMRALHSKMPKWNYPNNKFELDLWHRDQDINMRGVYVDIDLARGAIAAVDVAQKGLADRVAEATDGEVQAATQRDKLLQHILAEYGVSLPDMTSATLERRLADPDLPEGVRELIGIRLQASVSSVSKYKRLLKGVSSDGYIRGLLQFSGAPRTQRWAGRLLQPQNFLRPTLPQADVDFGIEAFKIGCADLIADNVMELAANCMRGVIIAPPGKKIVVSDLSNIEGRAAAYLAGEAWKLTAFRQYDDGTGPDLYVMAYAKAFRVALDSVDKDQRQIGKVMELAFGYAGGVGAWLTFAAAYGIDLQDLTDRVLDTLPSDVCEEAQGFWDWSVETKRNTFGMSRETFIVCDGLKRVWRHAHPRIENLWRELENAARDAIANPGIAFAARLVLIIREGNWLRIMLPSGDCLSYPSPRVDDSGAISYLGMNQYTHKWSRIKTYGGKLFENTCQKFARNCMAHNMPRIEEAGYDVRLTVHDEIITYAPDEPEFNAEHLSALLANTLKWAPEMPLAAAGFESYRYRKG